MGKFKKNKGKGAKVVKTKYHGGSKAITKQRKNALLSWLHPFAQQNEPFLKRLQGNPSGILNAVRAVKPNDQVSYFFFVGIFVLFFGGWTLLGCHGPPVTVSTDSQPVSHLSLKLVAHHCLFMLTIVRYIDDVITVLTSSTKGRRRPDRT